jgi:hypothetical protein
LTLRKLVSPSRHSPSCWIRWVTATRMFATAMPVLSHILAVYLCQQTGLGSLRFANLLTT